MLNVPEVAIVALGRVRPLPRLVSAAASTDTARDAVLGGGQPKYNGSDTNLNLNGLQLVQRHVMAVSWGGDHRVLDGAAIATAHAHWKALLEQPLRLLLHTR
jgi:2-oxoisovalerate dehydrogenase E2 component (dihydrolipoyl transacylase)